MKTNEKGSANSVKLVLFFVLLIAVMTGGLYWIVSHSSRMKSERLNQVNRDFGYAKGVIIKMSFYKGHAVDVRYNIEGRQYMYSGGWDRNPGRLRVGDSIRFRYARENPALIVTELEYAF